MHACYYRFLCFLMAALFVGCAYSKQQVAIKVAAPKTIRCHQQGNGKVFFMAVVDERKDMALGKRANAFGTGAAITSEGDVMGAFKEGLQKNFAACGYTATLTHEASSARLVVALRFLNYSTSVGFWTGGIHIKGAAMVTVRTQGHPDWSKMIREEKEMRKAFVPTKGKNSEWINEVFNNLIRNIVTDSEIGVHLI